MIKIKFSNRKVRLIYLVAFLVLFGIEVLIALFVHDSFIRPYFGDVLVVILIYCFIRILIPEKIKLLPLYVFIFATAVEVGQCLNYVELLGLGNSQFFRTLLGTSFSWYDILCYAVGCAVCGSIEVITYLKEKNVDSRKP